MNTTIQQITLELNEKQSEVLKFSLEIFSKIATGNFKSVETLPFLKKTGKQTQKALNTLWREIQEEYFPESIFDCYPEMDDPSIKTEGKTAFHVYKQIKDAKKNTIHVSKIESQIILRALNTTMRVGLGQFHSIADIPFLFESDYNSDRVSRFLEAIKSLHFPQLRENQYYSIGSPDTPYESKVAFDVYQVVEHAISWYEEPKGGMGVNFRDPLQYSNESLPKIIIH